MRVHWFSFTVHCSSEHGLDLWRRFFAGALGVLVSTGHGGRGFEEIAEGLLGSKFYSQPIKQPGVETIYYHVELPGQACDALLPSVFSDLVDFLNAGNFRWKMKRLDLAFDNVPFKPLDVLAALQENKAVTLAKRENVEVHQSPFAMAEDGSHLGTCTVTVGDEASQRMIRVYDKRGPTRLEIQFRDQRAMIVALAVFFRCYDQWESEAKSHLRQYIEFVGCGWWALFLADTVRASIKISAARQASLARIEEWFERQVVVALSVYEDVHGREEAWARIQQMTKEARAKRDRSRYASVLQLA